MNPEEARRRVGVEFGGVEQIKEECRDQRPSQWIESLTRDFRYALRQLRRSPGFLLAVLATLGLCIGVNTAVYSVVDTLLLRPLPYPEPERLGNVAVRFDAKGREGIITGANGLMAEIVRDHASLIDSAPFVGASGANFAVQGRAEYIQQQRVSTGYFRILGIAPLIGREFSSDEDRAGGPAAVILSHDFWRRFFQEDPGVIGRAITLRGEPHTIVGIMPRGFRTDSPADIWTPLRPSTTGEGNGINYAIVARLRPGATWAAADGQLAALGGPVLAKLGFGSSQPRLAIVPLKFGQTYWIRERLFLLWGAVGLVLLIGCVNVAGLLLARSGGRMREIGTRLALGGSRGAIVRQFLTESVLLALGGGLLGVAIGYVALEGLKRLTEQSFSNWRYIDLDGRVLAGALVMSLLTSVLFGIAPAIQASRIDVRSVLSDAGSRGVAGGARRWMRQVLVLSEIALSIVLLVGAGLLIRTVAAIENLAPGFDPANVMTAQVSLADARYPTAERVDRLFTATLARIAQIPGVEAAAAALTLPYDRAMNSGFILKDGPGAGQEGISDFVYVTPGFFATLRIPLIQGRTFSAADSAKARKVAVVNRAFEKRYLRDQQTLGRHLDDLEIVGVVGDVRQQSGWGDTEGPMVYHPTVYFPVAQSSDGTLPLMHTWFSPSWIVRARGDRGALIAGIQRAVESFDPQLPIAGFRSIDQARRGAVGSQRMLATLLAIFAALALVLAAVGIYGLIAHLVTERAREMGIRMALGATLQQAMSQVAAPGVRLAACGVVLGGAIAFAITRVLAHFLWGVSARDPFTFIMAGAVLLGVAAAASILPALRLARLDPAQTLRHE
ncbi:MAG: ABC transporter permease [Candidatus Solibacter usitatus]|nr:ABC transporter permease [Candidatus Solibacter usitatus]